MRKLMCILSSSSIARDARVLRQIEYLLPHYQVTAVVYGEAPDLLSPDRGQWYSL